MWYPRGDGADARTERLRHEVLAATGEFDVLDAHLTVPGDASTAPAPVVGNALVQPPYGFDDELESLLPELAELLAPGGSWGVAASAGLVNVASVCLIMRGRSGAEGPASRTNGARDILSHVASDKLVLALAIDDLPQPEPRPSFIRHLTQPVEERPAKNIRGDSKPRFAASASHSRARVHCSSDHRCQAGDIHQNFGHPPWVAGRRAALVPRAGLRLVHVAVLAVLVPHAEPPQSTRRRLPPSRASPSLRLVLQLNFPRLGQLALDGAALDQRLDRVPRLRRRE